MEVHQHTHPAPDPDPSTSSEHRGRKKCLPDRDPLFLEISNVVPGSVLLPVIKNL